MKKLIIKELIIKKKPGGDSSPTKIRGITEKFLFFMYICTNCNGQEYPKSWKIISYRHENIVLRPLSR